MQFEQLSLFDDNPAPPKVHSLRPWTHRVSGEEVVAVEQNGKIQVYNPKTWRFVEELDVEKFLDEFSRR